MADEQNNQSGQNPSGDHPTQNSGTGSGSYTQNTGFSASSDHGGEGWTDPAAQNYAQGYNTYGQSQPTPPDSNATASLVLGIVSIALYMMCGCFPVSLILGIIGIVCAVKNKRTVGAFRGRAAVGFGLSLASLILSALAVLATIALTLVMLASPELMSSIADLYGIEIEDMVSTVRTVRFR